MSKWERVKIDEVCEKKIQTLKSSEDFLIEYVDISSVDNQEKKITSYQTIRSKEAPSRAKQILRKNDILVSTVRPNLNAVALNLIDSENMVVGSTGYCILRCSERIDTNYLFNFCKSKTFINGLVKVAKGASYPAVSNTDVKHSMISLPPLEIQKQIARTLDTAAELLAMRKQQLAELDGLIQSIFNNIFGDPVTNEMGWELKTIDDICMKITDGEHINPTFVDNGIRMVMANNVRANLDFKGCKYISGDDYKKFSKKCNPEFGDLLLVSRGATIGRACINNSIEKFSLMGSVILLKPRKNVVESQYLLSWLQNERIRQYLVSTSSASAQQAIYMKDLKKRNIFCPPIDLQNQFANIVTKIEEQKAIVKQAIDETQHLFDSLMSEYFE